MNARHSLRTLLLCGALAAACLDVRRGRAERRALRSRLPQGLRRRLLSRALAARDPKRLPVATSVKYTENGRVLELGEGFWKTAGAPLAYRDYILDPERPAGGRAHGVEGIRGHRANVRAAQGRGPDASRRSRRSSRASAISAGSRPRLCLDSCPTSSRGPCRRRPNGHSRAELVAAADAYFTAVQTEGTPQFVQAPFDPGIEALRERSADDERHRQPRVWSATPGRPSCSSSGRSTQARSSRIAAIPSSTSSTASRWPSPRSGATARTHVDAAARRDLQGHGRPAARNSRRDPESAERRRHGVDGTLARAFPRYAVMIPVIVVR